MVEGALVVLIVGLVAAAAWLSAGTLAWLGVGGVVVGFGFGLPTGVLYHILLYRALERHGGAPEGWLWGPIALHDRIPKRELRYVLPWCYAGALGFGVIVLGILAAVAALVKGGPGALIG